MGARVGVYCYFSAGEGSAFHDENIQTRIVVAPDGAALLEVTNLTDNPIYIDRGNSFSYVNDLSAPLFVPSSSTESHTYGRGVVEGNRHDDVKWISGESHTSSRTVFDQRIQPVAPHGTAVVYAWADLPRLLRPEAVSIGKEPSWFVYKCKGRFADSDHVFRKGESRNYSPADTPLMLTANLLYAVGADDGPRHRASVSDYVDRMVVGAYQGVSKEGTLAQPSPQANCFAFRSGRSKGAVIGEWATVGVLVVGAISIYSEAHSSPDMPDFPY